MAGDRDGAELQAVVALPNLADAVPVQLWQQVMRTKPALVMRAGCAARLVQYRPRCCEQAALHCPVPGGSNNHPGFVCYLPVLQRPSVPQGLNTRMARAGQSQAAARALAAAL